MDFIFVIVGVIILIYIVSKVFGEKSESRIHNQPLDKVENEIKRLNANSNHEASARLIVTKSIGLLSKNRREEAEKLIVDYFYADPQTNLCILEILDSLNGKFDSMPDEMKHGYMELWNILNKHYQINL